MSNQQLLSRLYWVLATPLAVALDAKPIWGNLQSPGTRWVWYLWLAGVLLSAGGVLLFNQPWWTDRVRQLGIALLVGALLVLSPMAFFLYLGVAGVYHIAVGLLVFWVWDDRTDQQFPVLVWGCLAAMLVILVVVPSVPPTGGSAYLIGSIPYMWFITALGFGAIAALTYSVSQSSISSPPSPNSQ